MLLCYLSLVLLLGTGLSGQEPGRFEPFPYCVDCVPTDQIVAPGVGFDLTTSYGNVPLLSICRDVGKL